MPRYSEASINRNKDKSRARFHKNRPHNRKMQQDYHLRKLEERPFIGWDGEGHSIYVVDSKGVIDVEHHYMLFGASTGVYVSGISLSTKECLDLILYVESEFPDAFHVGFSFEYDVNMILKDLEWRHLAILYDTGQVKWNGYRIKHTPHKMFCVSKDGVSARIYDVFGFFHCSYLAALRKFGVGTREAIQRISDGKKLRGTFTWAELAQVIAYWREEISLLPPLMDCIREAAYGGSFYITEWHGPGALAANALKYNKMSQYYSKGVPRDVQIAIRAAYAGGRFQAWRCGWYHNRVYTADINSAYIYAASLLPRLDNRKWHRVDPKTILSDTDIAHFGLYLISYDAGRDTDKAAMNKGMPTRPYPLFHRDRKGNLTWPNRVENWYWSPEARLVAGSKNATIREAWVYDEDGSRPFNWVHTAFQRRLILQHEGNPAQAAYKWALAAIYGQFARRVGWDKARRTAPRSHELAWAGFITSWCRAAVYEVALEVTLQHGLVSIDTDGITSTVPFPTDCLTSGVGENLGQWKLEEYEELLYWQNGVYWMRGKDGNWVSAKTRGVPKGRISPVEAEQALTESRLTEQPPKHPIIKVQRTRFIGYRQGLGGQFDKWRHWVSESVNIVMGGSGKGRHVTPFCRKCYCDKFEIDDPLGMELMHTITHLPSDEILSEPHKLPWLIHVPTEQNVTTEEEYIWRDEDYGA